MRAMMASRSGCRSGSPPLMVISEVPNDAKRSIRRSISSVGTGSEWSSNSLQYVQARLHWRMGMMWTCTVWRVEASAFPTSHSSRASRHFAFIRTRIVSRRAIYLSRIRCSLSSNATPHTRRRRFFAQVRNAGPPNQTDMLHQGRLEPPDFDAEWCLGSIEWLPPVSEGDANQPLGNVCACLVLFAVSGGKRNDATEFYRECGGCPSVVGDIDLSNGAG